jgi:hypothetical protein
VNGTLSRSSKQTVIIMEDSLPEIESPAKIFRIPLRSLCTPQRATTSAVAAFIANEMIIPIEAMLESIQMHVGEKVALYQEDIKKLLPLLS